MFTKSNQQWSYVSTMWGRIEPFESILWRLLQKRKQFHNASLNSEFTEDAKQTKNKLYIMCE